MNSIWQTSFDSSQFDKSFKAEFVKSDIELKPKFKEISEVGDYKEFQGPYVITPKAEEISLPTQNTLLKNNITIESIPFFEVSNTAGGNTIYIGGEIERR